jgi:pyruvate dehydrogenase E2 component (dihydrolipoyllysine-residue acetyltransferase)
MARWEFKLPDIGEGVGEGEIVAWLVRPGDRVGEDQPLVEVMTDKATVTITAPKAGTISETRGKVGETIPVHAVLVVFDVDLSPVEPQVNGRASHPEAPSGVLTETNGDLGEVSSRPFEGSVVTSYFDAKPLATPATRKLARDKNVDLRHVPPTGSQGRVTRKDVLAFVDFGAESNVSTAGKGVAPSATDRTVSVEPAPPLRSEKRIPLVGLRRRIAQRMSLSKAKAAHFTFVEECDVTELKALRGRLKAHVESEGINLTFLPLIIKATVAALRKYPMLNASLDEATNEIVLHPEFHVGVATATDAGLLVPVVRNADKRGIVDIAREIERLASAARAGKAAADDLHGSTFTITSLGARGGLFATPIINYPEVAILGIHQIKPKPVVREGQITIADVMLVSLSFDHRVVDGDVGAAFAYEVISYLEHPERLLLDMV